MKRLLLIIGFISFFNISCHSEKKAIIFDIGGVLLSSDIKKILSKCGYPLLLSYILKDKKIPTSVLRPLYSLINNHYGPPTSTLFDHYGNRLPQPFCLSFKGLKEESECLKEIIYLINDNPSAFCSSREQQLAKKIATVAFNPKIIKNVQTTHKYVIDILEECVDAGHEVIIFSNYAKQAFKSIYEEFSFFKKVPKKNFIVSGIHFKDAKTTRKKLKEENVL
jgi:hypothetical protein